MQSIFPILKQVTGYNADRLRGDLGAGLTVGVMLIPQGMAYALIAGLPPIYGLYTSLIPLVVYAFLGTSRQLAVGPVAMVSLLVAAGVGPLATDVENYIRLALTLAMMIGVMQIGLGFLRVGFLTKYLSHPVLAGFTSAAALIIAFSQLKHLLGLNLPKSNYVHEILLSALFHASEMHTATLLLGSMSIVLLLGLRRWRRTFPAALLLVVLATFAAHYLNLEQEGVAVVGLIPEGLPPITLPAFSRADLRALFPVALTITLVSYMESIAVAKVYARRHRYEIDANQELIALGSANLIGSFFSAFPNTGGFSRTAINDQAGAKTNLAAIFSAGVIALSLLLLTELFYFLPKAALAAIVVVAVAKLLAWKEAVWLWKIDRSDFFIMLLTFGATLSVGIEQGILFGVLVSMLPFARHLFRPAASTSGDTLIETSISPSSPRLFKTDHQLFFGNATSFRETVLDGINTPNPAKSIVLDVSPLDRIDSTGLHVLMELSQILKTKRIALFFGGLNHSLRAKLEEAGLVESLGKQQFFSELSPAIAAARSVLEG